MNKISRRKLKILLVGAIGVAVTATVPPIWAPFVQLALETVSGS